MKMKYDFGDSVQVAVTHKPCEIVAITPVENLLQGEAFNAPVGAVFYTVEFGDGSDALLPESDLEPFSPR